MFENIANTEPIFYCPNCNEICYAEWIDIGFGPYSQRITPYHCENCLWSEQNDYNNVEKLKENE